MKGALLVVLLATGTATATAAPVRDGSDDPHPGIHHEHWTDASIPAGIDLVRIDLTDSEIGAYATTEAQAGQTTSAFATSLDAQVAINGDSFTATGFVPHGLAMGSSAAWTDTTDDAVSALFHFARVERDHAGRDRPARGRRRPSAICRPARRASCRGGRCSCAPAPCRRASTAPTRQAIACVRAPRSALGLSADGTTMTLVVVDGWQQSSLGMTDAELAAFLVARGASVALALDSGSVVARSSWTAPSSTTRPTASSARSRTTSRSSTARCRRASSSASSACTTCSAATPTRRAGSPARRVRLDDGREQTTPSGSQPFYDFTSSRRASRA